MDHIVFYLPGILGLCIFACLCVILAAEQGQNRKRLFCLYMLPLVLLLVRFAPYLAGLEWRLAVRRPLDWACVAALLASVLWGTHWCGIWKRTEGPQARAAALALAGWFFLTCALLVPQIPVEYDRDAEIYIQQSPDAVLAVAEAIDPGSLTIKYYHYAKKPFRSLILIGYWGDGIRSA